MVTETPIFRRDAVKPEQIEALDRKRGVLNSEFAGRVHSVVSGFEDEVLVPSLIIHSEAKRRQVLGSLTQRLGRRRYLYHSLDMLPEVDEEELEAAYEEVRRFERRIATVEGLPPSPAPWVGFIDEVLTEERRALMILLGGTTGGHQKHDWDGLESRVSVGDLRKIEVSPEHVADYLVPTGDIFLSLAFRGL